MKTYTAAYKKSDSEFKANKVWLESEVDDMKKILAECVNVSEMKFNFEALNDMLFTKFRQLEDTKSAVRDLIVYQKYFHPIQMQNCIAENVSNMQSS